MSKELKRLYVFFIIALFIFIVLFPYMFLNINNSINYLKVKSTMVFREKKDTTIDIYNNRGNIIIAFDDGWKTQYTVRI